MWSEQKNHNKITLQLVWEKPKHFDLILPIPVAMASIGPANDASTGTPAATGATAVAGDSTEGEVVYSTEEVVYISECLLCECMSIDEITFCLIDKIYYIAKFSTRNSYLVLQ